MPHHLHPLSLAVLLALLCTGCACGRVGTLAARRTLTASAEVVDVYGFGALLRPGGVDGGGTLGWRHATYIYPRLATGAGEESVDWTWGWVPEPRATPFFLVARSLGGEVALFPDLLQAHLGFRMDAFTFAAAAGESRVVNFTYRPDDPGQTILAIQTFPNPDRP